MANKTWTTWLQTQTWCMSNPGKQAAIVTPQGTFTIVFTKPEQMLKGMDSGS